MAVLIGNLTRDPEMRYTPKGSPVTTFGVATNRVWTTSEGEKQEATDFHNVAAWGKLAEICNQFLRKGRKVYIQGRIHNSSWDAPDGTKKYRSEVVADDMVILDSKRVEDFEGGAAPAAASSQTAAPVAGDENVSVDEIEKGTNEQSSGNPTPF